MRRVSSVEQQTCLACHRLQVALPRLCGSLGRPAEFITQPEPSITAPPPAQNHNRKTPAPDQNQQRLTLPQPQDCNRQRPDRETDERSLTELDGRLPTCLRFIFIYMLRQSSEKVSSGASLTARHGQSPNSDPARPGPVSQHRQQTSNKTTAPVHASVPEESRKPQSAHDLIFQA